MSKYRCTPVAFIALLTCLSFIGPAQGAETYPARPIRWIVPFPPGGGTDFFARLFGPKVAEDLKQQVVIDNRGGAGGVVGTQIAASAAPDGYTFLLTTAAGIVVNPMLNPKLPYSLNDFAPVSLLVVTPQILVVNAGLPVHTTKELIALAKAKPGQLNYSSSGNGAANHLCMELFKTMTGIDAVHVPFKGTGPAITELIAGRIQLMFNPLPPFLPHIKAGRLRALGVGELQRYPALPDLPTLNESGVPGFEYALWYGMFAPAKTAPAAVAKMNEALGKLLRDPVITTQLIAQGAVPRPTKPADFAAYVRTDRERLQKVIRAAGVKAE